MSGAFSLAMLATLVTIPLVAVSGIALATCPTILPTCNYGPNDLGSPAVCSSTDLYAPSNPAGDCSMTAHNIVAPDPTNTVCPCPDPQHGQKHDVTSCANNEELNPTCIRWPFFDVDSDGCFDTAPETGADLPLPFPFIRDLCLAAFNASGQGATSCAPVTCNPAVPGCSCVPNCGCSAYLYPEWAEGLDALADSIALIYLTSIGLLTKEGARYALGPDATVYLDRHSPVYFGSVVTSMAGETNLQAFARLTAAVRRGGTALPEGGALAPEHPAWVEFARAMAPVGAFMGPLLATLLDVRAGGRIKVLDIAAGHGLHGIAVATANPAAEVVALDWANVLAVAREHATAAGVAQRYRTIPGSVFTEEFGEGYDLVLLTNFLPDFDPAACERLLAKVHAALGPNGRAVALQLVLNDDRVAPPAATGLSLGLLATTPGGDVYTFAEVERMFGNAGFRRMERHELPPEHVVVIAYR